MVGIAMLLNDRCYRIVVFFDLWSMCWDFQSSGTFTVIIIYRWSFEMIDFNGGSQLGKHSICESKNTMASADAAREPTNLLLIKPVRSFCRISFNFTFCNSLNRITSGFGKT